MPDIGHGFILGFVCALGKLQGSLIFQNGIPTRQLENAFSGRCRCSTDSIIDPATCTWSVEVWCHIGR